MHPPPPQFGLTEPVDVQIIGGPLDGAIIQATRWDGVMPTEIALPMPSGSIAVHRRVSDSAPDRPAYRFHEKLRLGCVGQRYEFP